MSKTNSRQNWGKSNVKLPELDLTAVQTDSYKWFLEEGIQSALQAISPIEDFTGKNWELEFSDHTLGSPKLTPQQAKEKGLSFEAPLKAKSNSLTSKPAKPPPKKFS